MRRAYLELRGVPLDLAQQAAHAKDRVVAEPWRSAMSGTAGDLDPHRQHALRLDPDVHVGRLTGDREVTRVAAID